MRRLAWRAFSSPAVVADLLIEKLGGTPFSWGGGSITGVGELRATYTYDAAGRLKTKSFPAVVAENIAYTYDQVSGGNKGIGRLTSVVDQSGPAPAPSTAWVYNALGQVVTESRYIQAKTYATNYNYDAAGNVTGITYPSGRIVTIARNSLGQISQITTKKNAASASANVATAVTWMPMSNLPTSFTHGNGLVTGAGYDLDYRLTVLQVIGPTPVSRFQYGYSDGINLTDITDVLGPDSVSLSYTPANRLASATGPWGTATYTYDAVGNRTSETIGASARVLAYPASSNRISTESLNGSLVRSFAHDGAGNITAGLPLGASYSLAYN